MFCCLSMAGCATWALDMAPKRPDQPWTPATTSEGEIIAGEQGTSNKESGYVLPANPALAKGLPTPTINPGKVYSLSDLVDLAESTNPTTRIAWDEAKRAALAAGIVESAYLPQITAGALTGWQSGGVKSTVTGVGSSSSSSLTGTVGALSMNWLLFDFGERVAVIDAAKQLSVVSNIAFTEAHQQVILAVALAFYANSAAEARLATASQSLKNATAVQSAAEDRYSQGVGTVTEVAQARQGTAQAKLALVEATGRAQDAYVAVLTAVGVSPTLKVKVADVSGRKLSPASAKPVEAIIADALARRPDMQGAYAAEKASQAKVSAAEAEFMPKVFVNAAGTYNQGNLDVTALPSVGQNIPATLNISAPRWGGSVFAGFAVPVYDGGSRAALLAQANSDADAAAARLERIRQDAVRQIVLADNGLHTSLAAYSASQALAAAAQTTFDSALNSYRSGEASITDLNLAQNQLFQARNASADAHSAALSAAATLAFATGALGQAPQ
jgi:outer membrane protein